MAIHTKFVFGHNNVLSTIISCDIVQRQRGYTVCVTHFGVLGRCQFFTLKKEEIKMCSEDWVELEKI